MKTILHTQFKISMEPAAKGRPRHRLCFPKMETVNSIYQKQGISAALKYVMEKAFVNTYTPEKTRANEKVIKSAFISHINAKGLIDHFPHENALAMSVVAHMPIRKSWPKARKIACEHNAIYHVMRPDTDNIFKLVADALTGVAYEADDQIYTHSCTKVFSPEPFIAVGLWLKGN
jgi:Holliday junction resolvase RusA-like endonuclease